MQNNIEACANITTKLRSLIARARAAIPFHLSMNERNEEDKENRQRQKAKDKYKDKGVHFPWGGRLRSMEVRNIT